MAAELPPDITTETIWVIEGRYAPDAAELRRPYRAEHLARIARLRDEGVILEAGAFADMTSSMLLCRVASEEEAMALARDDVYLREGVWVEVRCRAFSRAIRSSEAAGR
jgi:uncharacterized protein YciI